MPFLVGLTGGIGSGKSAVAEFFVRRGITVVDTDTIAHELTVPGGAAIQAIRAEFGPESITADGALDRARMRALVFRDSAARRRLEHILHPLIRAESAARASAAPGPYVVLVVPLLVESGVRQGNGGRRYQRVLVVDCAEDKQVERVTRRSGLPEDEVRRIIASQAGRRARLAAADDVIDNGGALADLEPQVERLHRHYLTLAEKSSYHGG